MINFLVFFSWSSINLPILPKAPRFCQTQKAHPFGQGAVWLPSAFSTDVFVGYLSCEDRSAGHEETTLNTWWKWIWSIGFWVHLVQTYLDYTSGWWFGTWFFPIIYGNIWDVILPIDELHHFSRWLLHHQPAILWCVQQFRDSCSPNCWFWYIMIRIPHWANRHFTVGTEARGADREVKTLP